MKPCPICKKESSAEHRPFCSARCRDVDLHRWFGETYRVPVTEAESEDDLAVEAQREEPKKPH
jgi:endogenous inhibitor of DNA gyrase (YacG/DUF329 family)